MLRLVLLRHAKSAWPDGVADHDRPLAPRGQEAAPLIGAHLAAEGIRPKLLLVSTARRTRETAALVADKADLPKPVFEPGIYEASWSRLIEIIRERGGAHSPLMLVGHNPGIASLAGMLADPALSNGDALRRLTAKVPTAALAVIDFDVKSFADVKPGTGVLAAFVTPKMLGGVDED
jgi:phosphohistidine phosphatase